MNLPFASAINKFFWDVLPSKLARVSNTVGYTATDGRYFLRFQNICMFLPFLAFFLGFFWDQFYTDPRNSEVFFSNHMVFLGCFILLSFISGGLGIYALAGFMIHYLFFYEGLEHYFNTYSRLDLNFFQIRVHLVLALQFLTLLIVVILPVGARALAGRAVRHIFGAEDDQVYKPAPILLYLLTEFLVIAVFITAWVYMVQALGFGMNRMLDIPYNYWTVLPFVNAEFWGWHPMIWVGLLGAALRYLSEFLFSFGPEKVEPSTLSPPFAWYKRVPMAAKSLLMGLIVSAYFYGYAEGAWQVSIMIIVVCLMYQLRDGLEVWLHRWYSWLERVPLAYRFPLLFAANVTLAYWLIEPIEHIFGLRILQAMVIVSCICLFFSFFFIAKSEPHRGAPPPEAPLWFEPLLRFLKKVNVPRGVRKKTVQFLPVGLWVLVVSFSGLAFAHHCFQGCPSCFFTDWASAWAITGLVMMGIAIGLLGGGMLIGAGLAAARIISVTRTVGFGAKWGGRIGAVKRVLSKIGGGLSKGLGKVKDAIGKVKERVRARSRSDKRDNKSLNEKRNSNNKNSTSDNISQNTKGLEKQLKAHKEKLKKYKKDPDSFDNKDFLRKASPELREKIIKSRIKKLEKQIETFQRDINSIRKGPKI